MEPRQITEAESDFDSPVAAANFRSDKRMSENGKVPDGAIALAISQRDLIVDPSDGAGVFPGGWTWHGPGNLGGRVRSILIHPTNTNIMWTGGLSGGIWKTIDAGVSWLPMDDFMPVMPIGCMALDQTNPNTLFAGTGEGFFETVEGTSNTAAVRGAGIFKSTDGGTSWSQIAFTNTPDWYFVNRIAISPTNSQNMLAATGSGVWRSTDGGTTWVRTSLGLAYDVQFHPTDGQKVISGFHDDGVKVSINGGLSWTAATGLPNPHRSEVRYAPSNPNTVYCAASVGSAIKIYRSVNGGSTFTLTTTGGGISTYAAYNNVLWVDPANANNLILGGVYLYRSANAGATFTQGLNGVHADMHAIVSDPNFNGTTNRRIFVGCDGGIYRSNDHTLNPVNNLNHNLGIAQVYGAVMNPANGNMIAGLQDNGTIRYTGLPQDWGTVFGGDGVYCEYDPTDVNYWYAGIYYAQIVRSTTGGAGGSYNYCYSGITDAGSSTTCNFIAYFGLDPSNANRMLVGARSLWRSNNIKAGTPTWTAIKPTIQPGGRPNGRSKNDEAHFATNPPWNISTFTIAQSNSNLIWVGYNNGEVWKTINGAAVTPTWTRVDNGATQLPARWVGSIRIDPNNTNRILVSFMGYESNNLWMTTNGGTNWTDISGDLPSTPISAVTTHPINSNWIYVGTDVGLFTSSDGGQNWSTQNVGPGIAPVEELRWVTGTKLLAVTHGRGVYSADILDSVTEPLSPTTYNIIWGNLMSGRLSSLYASDNDKLDILGDFTAPGLVTPMGVQFTSVSPHGNVSYLAFKLEVNATQRNLGLRTRLFNWNSNQWEELDFRPTTTTDSTFEFVATGDPSRFVSPANREIKALVTAEPWAADVIAKWRVRFDQVLFTVRQ